MSEEKRTRNVRSKEERIQELEKTIEYHKQNIAKLEEKIQKIKNSTPLSMNAVIKKAKDAGITPEDLLKMIEEKQ